MNKKWKGYMTVEASYVMPMVLLLYLLIIMSGFYLYDRCVISQDNYLLAFRGSRFTHGTKDYGEVIYGEGKEGEFEQQYIKERLVYKSGFYPFSEREEESVISDGKRIVISTMDFHGHLNTLKQAEQINPMEIVRKVRRQGHV